MPASLCCEYTSAGPLGFQPLAVGASLAHVSCDCECLTGSPAVGTGHGAGHSSVSSHYGHHNMLDW